MASYTVTAAKHATLTANVVDSVSFPSAAREVEVLNRSDFEIYAAVGSATPAVGGDDSWVVPARSSLRLPVTNIASSTVKLISASAAAYSASVPPA